MGLFWCALILVAGSAVSSNAAGECTALSNLGNRAVRLLCNSENAIDPADRLVFTSEAGYSWDSLAQSVSFDGKYSTVRLSSPVPRSFNASGAIVVVRECGSCADASGPRPFFESSVCGRCYFNQCPDHPVAYSHVDAPAVNEVWSYHVDATDEPEDVYLTLKASREVVFYCRNCNRWNETSRVASFSVCAVWCSEAAHGPPTLSAHPAVILEPLFRKHKDSTVPEMTASVFLLVATTILISGALLSSY